ncbi:MAG TPA: hypothetical protein VF815_45205 [Myxococcaceae bacterium]|jgi:hypothetical protein
MAKHMLKGFVVAGLLGLTGLAVGCQDNREADIREDTREVGQDLDNAADNAANDVRDFGREANEDLREGTGGSGNVDPNIGEREGVINDGEGLLEQNQADGTFLEDGKGPVDDKANDNEVNKKY